MTILRTRLVWLAMRLVPWRRMAGWHARGLLRPLTFVLLRGELSVLGGAAVGTRLGAAAFEPWGAQAYAVLTGTHELQVQEALRRTVGPGAVVWDVGANIGAFSLLAARTVGPAGRVVAIEPDARCAAAVADNAARNAIDWIDVHHVAAAAATEPTELVVVRDSLWTRLASIGGHEHEVERRSVAGYALDDLPAPAPLLVKIDVEGAELDVLRGMRRLLAEVRPVIVCEMHGTNAAFCEAIGAAGYDVLNLDGPEPVAQAGVNVHALCVPAGRLAA
ncbi:MAG: FkbM family methyltransferase [Solirubrobacteraceae bacterium]|nr:FkbM family methyltransferase [Solirubrobacteraceae bacterium]